MSVPANLFFSKVGTVVFPDDATKTRTIGEVYFLRVTHIITW